MPESKATRSISQGELVIECAGEVIDEGTWEELHRSSGTFFAMSNDEKQHAWADHAEADTYYLFDALLNRMEVRDVFVADLDTGKPGPTVLLRGDMDALPLDEQNTFAHRSPRAAHCAAATTTATTTRRNRNLNITNEVTGWPA